MKREAIIHGGIFTEESFARKYAKKHWNMATGFGETYGKRLRKGGFTRGRVLDMGCGFGAMNLSLARQFPKSELVGIDLSEPLLSMAREAAREGGVADRVSFRKEDVHEVPFEDDSFDVVLNLNMVHLVAQPGRMLAEAERVLRPGGFLFVADLKRSWLGWLEREIRTALSATEARDLIEASSLRGGAFSNGLIWWRYECLPMETRGGGS